MLKAGSSKTPTWSKAKSKPENPLPSSLSRSKDSEDSDNDDKVPIPIFRESFGDAIQTALETHMAKSKGIWSNILPNLWYSSHWIIFYERFTHEYDIYFEGFEKRNNLLCFYCCHLYQYSVSMYYR